MFKSKSHYLSEIKNELLYSNLITSLEKEYGNDIYNIELPKEFTEQIINDFNERNFVNENINDIIYLIDYLDIEFKIARKFIIKNLLKNCPIKIDDIHKTNYKLPSFVFEKSFINNSRNKYFINEMIINNAVEWLEF